MNGTVIMCPHCGAEHDDNTFFENETWIIGCRLCEKDFSVIKNTTYETDKLTNPL